VDKPAITYVERADTTTEAEISALSNVFRFVLDRQECKEGGPENRPYDPERRSDEIRAKASIP
jgi:hypothetical protein